ncbi:MAG: A24 family peptidase [Neisseria sp.]|nr:A24 family peptidase [Neisseria sp.]
MIFSPLLLAGFFLFGLLFGSFLNVVIYRLPLMMEHAWQQQAREVLKIGDAQASSRPFGLAYPPSHCPSCQTPIKPWSNIPILSFLLQKGRCAHCQAPISWRYPLVELLTGLAFAAIYWHFGWTLAAAGALVFTALVIAMMFIDAQTQLLPDILTLSLLWCGLLINTQGIFTSLPNAVWGAAIGYLSLWLIFQLFKLVTGKEGMGFGDFKLLAALGAWFGVSALPVIVLLSSVVGLIFAMILRIKKGQEMPFGPYLAVSGWLILMFQQPIMQMVAWWMNKSGFTP